MSFLSKDRTIAPPGYSRWLIPPAALCVHLCIGEAYAFSVFNLPMSKLSASRHDAGRLEADRSRLDFLDRDLLPRASAAVLGRWVEEGGPRKAMFTAACCFGGGFLIVGLRHFGP